MDLSVTTLVPVGGTVSTHFLWLGLCIQQSTAYWVLTLLCPLLWFYSLVMLAVCETLAMPSVCHSTGNQRWAYIHPCVSVLGALLGLTSRLGWQALPKGYAPDGHTDLQGSRFRGQLCPLGNWQEEDELPNLSFLPYMWLLWLCTSLFWCWCSL